MTPRMPGIVIAVACSVSGTAEVTIISAFGWGQRKSELFRGYGSFP